MVQKRRYQHCRKTSHMYAPDSVAGLCGTLFKENFTIAQRLVHFFVMVLMLTVLTAKHELQVASTHRILASERRQRHQPGSHLHTKISRKCAPVISSTLFVSLISYLYWMLTSFHPCRSFSKTILMAGYQFCCAAWHSLLNKSLDLKISWPMCISPRAFSMLPHRR